MIITMKQSDVSKKLSEFKQLASELKEVYEQVCAEWNDIELALSDASHFREFLEFSTEGILFLDEKRTRLLNERRRYKRIYASLLPYMVSIGEVVKTIDETKETEGPQKNYYGIRSTRGYNLFHELQPYCNASEIEHFADLTKGGAQVNHIHNLHTTYPQLFNKQECKVTKETPELRAVAHNVTITEFNEQIQTVIEPPKMGAAYTSYADCEARETWQKLMYKEETPERKKARLEKQLQNTLQAGSRYGRRR